MRAKENGDGGIMARKKPKNNRILIYRNCRAIIRPERVASNRIWQESV